FGDGKAYKGRIYKVQRLLKHGRFIRRAELCCAAIIVIIATGIVQFKRVSGKFWTDDYRKLRQLSAYRCDSRQSAMVPLAAEFADDRLAPVVGSRATAWMAQERGQPPNAPGPCWRRMQRRPKMPLAWQQQSSRGLPGRCAKGGEA